MTRTRLILFIAALGMTAAFSAGPSVSTAYACDELGIFWKMSPLGSAYGAINYISLHDHAISCVVEPTAASGHTARVQLNGWDGYYYEVGYKLYPCGATRCTRAFAEWSIGGSGAQWNSWTPGWPCLYDGTSAYWKVQGVVGSPYTWRAYVNCLDGLGARQLDEKVLTGYAYGNAEGEGFYREPNGSGMAETHSALQLMNSVGGWSYSTNVGCRRDDSSSWNGRYLSATSFDFVSSGGTAC